jgi:hypothetical protein
MTRPTCLPILVWIPLRDSDHLAIVVARSPKSDNVLHALGDLFVECRQPDHIRSDNGSEFTAIAVRDWLGRIGVRTLYPSDAPGTMMWTRCCLIPGTDPDA